ncbi:PIG-L deacetylase family protein [Mumia sp. DW29H23]|uniref:PIG-L deacetylase family protein n=1 Tax=Mumia sp. DW29H23 TaxID=3421241 RepID=UPI003D68BDF7
MADAQTETPALKPLDEDWETALAVVAHPDDMEFGAAAAVARWTGQGKRVVYCMATAGEAGIDGMEPERTREVRTAEEIESARIVGVDTVEFLGLPDGIVEYGVPLRRLIARMVRVHKPEIVITGNFQQFFPNRILNQADHIAVGRATLDAVRDAGNRWVFPEPGIEPWGGVRQVWVSGSPDARHGVDISDTFDAGVASLRAHQAYLDGLGWVDFDPAAFLASMAEPAGELMGTRYATSFEVFSLTFSGDD